MLKSILIALLSVAISLTCGILHVMYAGKLTEFWRNYYASSWYSKSALMSPIRAWVESKYYESWMRIFGVLLILMGLFIAFVMIRGLLSHGS